MSFIDTNLTYSTQVCDLAVGSIAGAGIVGFWLIRVIWFLLIFYLIKKITEFLINASNNRLKYKIHMDRVEQLKKVMRKQ